MRSCPPSLRHLNTLSPVGGLRRLRRWDIVEGRMSREEGFESLKTCGISSSLLCSMLVVQGVSPQLPAPAAKPSLAHHGL